MKLAKEALKKQRIEMRINKFVVVVFFTVFTYLNGTAQNDTIFYEFPATVTERIERHINFSRSSSREVSFFVKLDKLDKSRYIISVIEHDFFKPEDLLLDTAIIRKTNRIVKIHNILIPLITGEDLEFAYLGYVPPRNGKKGRKRVVINNDGFTLIFDRVGKIYEERPDR